MTSAATAPLQLVVSGVLPATGATATSLSAKRQPRMLVKVAPELVPAANTRLGLMQYAFSSAVNIAPKNRTLISRSPAPGASQPPVGDIVPGITSTATPFIVRCNPAPVPLRHCAPVWP